MHLKQHRNQKVLVFQTFLLFYWWEFEIWPLLLLNNVHFSWNWYLIYLAMHKQIDWKYLIHLPTKLFYWEVGYKTMKTDTWNSVVLHWIRTVFLVCHDHFLYKYLPKMNLLENVIFTSKMTKSMFWYTWPISHWQVQVAWKEKLGLGYKFSFSSQCTNAGCDEDRLINKMSK